MKLKEDQQRRSACAVAMLDLQQTAESPGMSPDLMQPADNPQSEDISGNGTLNYQGYADAGCQTELTMDDIEKMEDVLRQQHRAGRSSDQGTGHSSTSSPLKKMMKRLSSTQGSPTS
ncbi:unnamed protein product [Arctogadus glacialis]